MFSPQYPSDKKKEAETAATNISIPAAHNDILLTALERHKMGQMHPMVHQLLTKGEVKLPVLLEDLSANDLPPIHNMYQPLRQSIYAVAYNAYHLKFTRRQYEETMKAKKKRAEEFRKEAGVRVPDFV